MSKVVGHIVLKKTIVMDMSIKGWDKVVVEGLQDVEDYKRAIHLLKVKAYEDYGVEL